jgi:general stress protein YciG
MPLQSRIDVESGQRTVASEAREDRTAEDQRKMSRAEAGRKGGLSTKQRYGGDHFSRIGRLGGKKGGESTKRRYGVDFYKRIGRKGGSS